MSASRLMPVGKKKKTAHQVKVRQVSIVNIDQALDWISKTSTLNPHSSILPAHNVERFKSIALENLSRVDNQSASFAFIESQREVGEHQATTAKPQKKSRKKTLIIMSFLEDF